MKWRRNCISKDQSWLKKNSVKPAPSSRMWLTVDVFFSLDEMRAKDRRSHLSVAHPIGSGAIEPQPRSQVLEFLSC